MNIWTKIEIVLTCGMIAGLMIMNPYIIFGCMFSVFFILGVEEYVKWCQNEL